MKIKQKKCEDHNDDDQIQEYQQQRNEEEKNNEKKKNEEKEIIESSIVPILCCAVYPPEGPLRVKPISYDNEKKVDKANKNKEENLNDSNNNESDIVNSLRYIDPYISSHSYGPIKSVSDRESILTCFTLLCRTADGRNGLRMWGGYEVLRCWHMIEEEDCIKENIENIIHLVVYSEEELAEQDALKMRFS